METQKVKISTFALKISKSPTWVRDLIEANELTKETIDGCSFVVLDEKASKILNKYK